MSGFQTYLDNAEHQTGLTPRQFLTLAHERGLDGAKAAEVTAWLKTDHGLGHGHAANLAQLITKGVEAATAKYGEDGVLHLDGLDAREGTDVRRPRRSPALAWEKGTMTVIQATPIEALYAAERDRLTSQLEVLEESSWRAPSLCEGWSVRDVCAHLLMPYELGLGGFARHLLAARFDFDRLADRWARRDQRTGRELTEALGQTTAAGFAVPGASELAPLAHLTIHAEDIRGPLNLAGLIAPRAAVLVLDSLTQGKHSVGDHLLGGLRVVTTDVEWSRGEGPEVHGDAVTLISALNGRHAPAERLRGPGASDLRWRLGQGGTRGRVSRVARRSE